MGTFGTGCCAGGGWGGPGSSSFGSGQGGPSAPLGLPDEAPLVECDPDLMPQIELPPLPDGGGEWPKWMEKKGCGAISILWMQELTQTDAKGRKLNFGSVLNPQNVKAFRKCVKETCKVDIAKGFPITAKFQQCLIECKKELMASLPGGPIYVDPSSVNGSEVDCPPNCVGQTASVGLHYAVRKFLWDTPFARPGRKKQVALVQVHHQTTCKLVSCPSGGPRCFKCQDPGVGGQSTNWSEVCIDGNGNFSKDMKFQSGLNDGDFVGPPGSCAEKFKNGLPGVTAPGTYPPQVLYPDGEAYKKQHSSEATASAGNGLPPLKDGNRYLTASNWHGDLQGKGSVACSEWANIPGFFFGYKAKVSTVITEEPC